MATKGVCISGSLIAYERHKESIFLKAKARAKARKPKGLRVGIRYCLDRAIFDHRFSFHFPMYVSQEFCTLVPSELVAFEMFAFFLNAFSQKFCCENHQI